MTKKIKNLKVSIWWPIVWFIIITTLFCLPGSDLPKVGWLDKIHFDKWVHTSFFTLLVFLCGAAYYWKNPDRNNSLPAFILIGIVSACYGIGIEFIQDIWIPNRSFDVWDIVFDGTGSVLGILILTNLYKKIDPCGNRGRNQN